MYPTKTTAPDTTLEGPPFLSRKNTGAGIAPTLAAMLRITEPNGNIGKVIQEVMTGMKR